MVQLANFNYIHLHYLANKYIIYHDTRAMNTKHTCAVPGACNCLCTGLHDAGKQYSKGWQHLQFNLDGARGQIKFTYIPNTMFNLQYLTNICSLVNCVLTRQRKQWYFYNGKFLNSSCYSSERKALNFLNDNRICFIEKFTLLPYWSLHLEMCLFLNFFFNFA